MGGMWEVCSRYVGGIGGRGYVRGIRDMWEMCGRYGKYVGGMRGMW